MVDAVLKSLGLEQYFQVVATACEVAAGKPAPDIYLKVAADLAYSRKNVWYLRTSRRGFWLENGLVCALARSRTYFHFP